MTSTSRRSMRPVRHRRRRAVDLLVASFMGAVALVTLSTGATSASPPRDVATAGYGDVLKPGGGGFEAARRVGDPVEVAPAPSPSGSCSNPVPSGTTFGTSISAVGQSAEQSLRDNDARFGELQVVRDYYPGLPANWRTPRARITGDRQVVVSFKLTPQAILSGRHDAFFENWFATAPKDRIVYWSYHHEPEGQVKHGDFTAAQYRAAWRRLDGFADAACKPNMHATLILSAWTIHPQAGDWHVYDAGKDVIDVVALDPYNRIFQPTSTEYDPPEKILGPIVTAMRADGRPFGVAELGSRVMRDDPDGRRRVQWLRSMGDYAIANDLTFVSYFQSTRGADWRLLDSGSTAMWRSFVTRPR